MFSVNEKDISYKYEDSAEKILDNIEFNFDSKSRIGLIGRNGCGKTTLFKLFTGQISDLYERTSSLKNLRLGYLPQEPEFSGSETVGDYIWKANSELYSVKVKLDGHYSGMQLLNEGIMLELLTRYDNLDGYRFEVELDKLLEKFGMGEIDLSQQISDLSGGEKTKAALIKLMMQDPQLLLLDEPTNHLDRDQLEWLEKYLSEIRLPFIVISHDRKFLDNTVNTIWEIENRKLRSYSGNYSFYRYEKDEEFERKMHEHEVQTKKINQLKKVQGQRTEWAKSYQRETGPEGGGFKYEDITNLGKKAMKRAKNIENRISRIIEKEEAKKPFIEKERKIDFGSSELKNKIVLTVKDLSKDFDGIKVLENLSFEVRNGERLEIKGKNGSGKSTLLKVITDNLIRTGGLIKWAPKAKVEYYAQEYENLDPDSNILTEVMGDTGKDQTRARIILGSLNIRRDDVFKSISELSPGEKSKTALARIIYSESDVLVLDEPTNHLEISAREAVEDSLLQFNGTVIFVSHDRYFAERIGTSQLTIDN